MKVLDEPETNCNGLGLYGDGVIKQDGKSRKNDFRIRKRFGEMVQRDARVRGFSDCAAFPCFMFDRDRSRRC